MQFLENRDVLIRAEAERFDTDVSSSAPITLSVVNHQSIVFVGEDEESKSLVVFDNSMLKDRQALRVNTIKFGTVLHQKAERCEHILLIQLAVLDVVDQDGASVVRSRLISDC